MTTPRLYKALGLPEDIVSNEKKFIQVTREGISGDLVRRAAKTLDNRDVFVRVLGTTHGNLSRYYRLKKMGARDSEEILDTLQLYSEAERIFGDRDVALEWLKNPVAALAGDKPEDLFDTFKGREWVRQTLRKIEYGEFV
jgi:putative toxin-antitoxin system antitoxin component (TIGR02293 family)